MPSIQIPYLGLSAQALAFLGRQSAGVQSRDNIQTRYDITGATVQSDRINITAATNSETYVVRFSPTAPLAQGPFDLAVETDSGTSQTELRDAIVAAINDSPEVLALITSATAGTNIVTIVWKSGFTGAISFPTNPSTDLTLTSLATAASAPQYYYGRAVELSGAGIRAVQAPAGATWTYTIVHDASDTYTIAGVYQLEGGSPITWSTTFAAGADLAAAVANAITALEAAFPFATVTNPSAGVVSVVLQAGAQAWNLTGVSDDAGTVTPSAVTAAAALPTLALCVQDDMTGVPEQSTPTTGPVGPLPGHPVATADASGSSVWAVPATVTAAGSVHVETSGASAGLLLATPTATSVPWPAARFLGSDPNYAGIARLLY